MGVTQSVHGVDKGQLQEDIKALQAALDLLPDVTDNAELRSSLATKIAGKKAAIIACKPLGARIDGCRGALERAQTRKANAMRSLSEAQAAIEQSDLEVAHLALQLQQLESEVATHAEPSEQANSIEGMASALSRVLTEMKSSPMVVPETWRETEVHMTNLKKGIRTIVASKVAPPTPPLAAGGKIKATETGVHRRVKGKTVMEDTTFTEGVDSGAREPTDHGGGMDDGPGFR